MPRKQTAPKAEVPENPLPPLADPPPVIGSSREPSPVREVPVADIAPWPDNPRRFSDDAKFRELVTMVEAKGVLQNIVLRPHPTGPELYQIVCGERRWRAAIRTGLQTIPAAVRHLSDKDAFELAVIENVGREDMSPVDEARAYQHMLTSFGYAPEDVAAKVGKAVKYVHQRLVLCALVPKALDWLRDDRMTVGGAIELARVDPEVQSKFLSDMEFNTSGWREDTGGAMNALEVRGRLRSEYLSQLLIANAQFSTSDPNLVPAAGSCVACPKNTASQRMLFGESKDDDAACLDAACWRSKVDAACAAAVKAGAQLLEGPEAAKLITSYGELDYKSKLKPLSSSCYVGYSADQSETEDDGPADEPRDRRPTHRTYGDLLKPALDARPDELVLVRNPKNPGQVFQCVREERLLDLLKESGQAALAASQEKQQKRQEKSPSQQKQEQKAKAEDLARREAMGRMGSFVEEELGKGWSHPGYSFEDLESFLREVVSLVWTKKGSLAAKRRGLGDDGAPGGDFDAKKVKADPRLAELPLAALVGFLVELVVEERAGGMYPSPRALRVFRQIPGLDLDALTKQHLQQLRAGKPTVKKKRS